MFKHARELEFEEAAELRDEIDELRKQGFGPSNKTTVRPELVEG
ncbi:MAG TPA: hypothetical protein ENI68_03885 [Gammaproteobacteria bacterium]|nr:hypothetical protein [Gammaproteobacteria bacterium]